MGEPRREVTTARHFFQNCIAYDCCGLRTEHLTAETRSRVRADSKVRAALLRVSGVHLRMLDQEGGSARMTGLKKKRALAYDGYYYAVAEAIWEQVLSDEQREVIEEMFAEWRKGEH